MTTAMTDLHLWNKGSWPQVDVVGEKFHEDAIRSLFPRGQGNGSVEFEGSAHLVHEPQNPHDRNAISVRVGGQTIGYLAREVAARYAHLVQRLTGNGHTAVVPCRVWASEYDDWQGTDRRGRDVFRAVLAANATIVLDEPHLCVPANLPPTGAHRLLPHGAALQVKGEEEHLDVLAPFVREHGEAWTYATLHLVTIAAGRTEKRVVELRIDGQVIGQLTPAMSAHYVPVIDHLDTNGQIATAKLLLKGNPIQVEAVLHAARSHELDGNWLAERSHPGPHAPSEVSELRATSDEPPRVILPFEVPAKPGRIVFTPPPGWPPAPEGWEPWPGWQPEADWPAPPAGWSFWTMK